jgi:uncharacterized membrane protein
MTRPLGTYAAVFGVMLALDFLWLGLIAKPLYQQAIGHLMAERPNLPVAFLFYVVYALGLTIFAVWPQAAVPGWRMAAAMGALFGFFAYATYDLTNLATLKGWPVGIALIDMAWGAVVSAISAVAGKWAMDRLAA